MVKIQKYTVIIFCLIFGALDCALYYIISLRNANRIMATNRLIRAMFCRSMKYLSIFVVAKISSDFFAGIAYMQDIETACAIYLASLIAFIACILCDK